MLTNALVFMVSSVGICLMSFMQESCRYPVWWFMVTVGFESILGTSWFARLAFLEYGPDSLWIKIGFLAFFVNLIQMGTTAWGVYILLLVFPDETCMKEAPTSVYICATCVGLFG